MIAKKTKKNVINKFVGDVIQRAYKKEAEASFLYDTISRIDRTET